MTLLWVSDILYNRKGYCLDGVWGGTPVLDQTTQMNLLYDFYGTLLTEKQRSLLELYYVEDWSLGEIAEHQGVSRQAVYEAIKRAQSTMLDLEESLGLVKSHLKRQQLIETIKSRLDQMPEAAKAIGPLIRELEKLD